MIYQMYQAQADAMMPLRRLARIGESWARIWDIGPITPPGLKHFGAACGLLADAGLSHHRPSFNLDTITVGNGQVRLIEEEVDSTPFAGLVRFRKAEPPSRPEPRVLVVAPMSGHFATLLRGTVATLAADHEVYITDWRNARDIPLSAGRFGMDEYVDHVMRFQAALGPGGHMVAVCQPAVAALAATAVMSERRDPARPRSLTLMAGPIDTRVNPTKVNVLAQSRPISWFERELIARVPWRYKGAGRRVYPGFVQLTAFMSMNLDRHVAAHLGQFRALVGGEAERARAHRAFYEEYGAVMDLPAEFYLETVNRVFQTHDLPLGKLTWHGQKVRPEAIRSTALFAVEGERDDICSVGQTMAVLDLCKGIPNSRKRYHLQAGVGHYGVFSGRRWQNEVYPRLRAMIQTTS